jgi:hypothetical protein
MRTAILRSLTQKQGVRFEMGVGQNCNSDAEVKG